MPSNNEAGSFIASLNQSNLRITLTMTKASFDILLEQAINLIYKHKESISSKQEKATVDAIESEVSIELVTFSGSREIQEVETLMPELYQPLNLFDLNEDEYEEARSKFIIDKNKEFLKAKIARQKAAEKTYAICDSETSQRTKCEVNSKQWT